MQEPKLTEETNNYECVDCGKIFPETEAYYAEQTIRTEKEGKMVYKEAFAACPSCYSVELIDTDEPIRDGDQE
ncbi:hypothetical protein [Candidatus Bathycorpusculum sp.]|uniref:hypothetical protein n=1 Tax=Candidatus Bathycorpusculum sp. TaxID=2994959 RepID=UPI002825FF05|nr:hypothetical protein [Candidatus Termitimicrobium sp.]MCL2685939.1 hypothetical protein [Candidatus Termitimicrobium sp.]